MNKEVNSKSQEKNAAEVRPLDIWLTVTAAILS